MTDVYVEQAGFLLPVGLCLFIPIGLLDGAANELAELDLEEASAGDVAGLPCAWPWR